MTLTEEQGTTHREQGTAKGGAKEIEEEEETNKTRHKQQGGRCRQGK
jgi:hypothetical protein